MILVTEGNIQYFLNGTMLGNTTRDSVLTSHPTVEGTSYVDHRYREADSLSFSLNVSTISKPLIYSVSVGDSGERVSRSLNEMEIRALLDRWFSDAVMLTITTMRYTFTNQVLKSITWSDGDLALFRPTLSFKEALVQKTRVILINNPDQYYNAAYGDILDVGDSTETEAGSNIVDSLYAAGAGALIGASIGSVIPFIGTAAGGFIGGAIGFFGSLMGD